jgi:cytochrome b561
MAATLQAAGIFTAIAADDLVQYASGYGALTKLLHWLVVVLFAFQFTAANVMQHLDAGATQLGLSQATYHNWHKSIGLIALVVALLRLLARKRGQLPDWAPTLSAGERTFVHRDGYPPGA